MIRHLKDEIIRMVENTDRQQVLMIIYGILKRDQENKKNEK